MQPNLKQIKSKDDLIEEILKMQQEIEAYEIRSQLLQHQNTFYETQIQELKADVSQMQEQMKR